MNENEKKPVTCPISFDDPDTMKPRAVNNIKIYPSKRLLSDNQVHEICKRLELGDHPTAIGKDYGVSKKVIDGIKFKESYTDISCKYNFKMDKILAAPLSDEQVINICEQLTKFKTADVIKMNTGISKRVIEDIKSKRTYKHITSKYEFLKTKPDPITPEKAIECAKLFQQGYSAAQVSKMDIGVSKRQAEDVKNRSKFAEFTKDYKW